MKWLVNKIYSVLISKRLYNIVYGSFFIGLLFFIVGQSYIPEIFAHYFVYVLGFLLGIFLLLGPLHAQLSKIGESEVFAEDESEVKTGWRDVIAMLFALVTFCGGIFWFFSNN